MKLLGMFALVLAVVVVVFGGVGATGGASNQLGSAAGASAKPEDSAAPEITATGALPEGSNGIARRYPGDAKIASDPAVIWADDFESYTKGADLAKRWDNFYQKQYVGIATAPANVYRGKQSLEFTLPKQEAELSDGVDKMLKPEREVLFLRYYSKYESPFDVVGSSHNGASISGHYFNNGQATPGIPANGTNKFLANLETWRGEAATASPGNLNIYIYHPAQRSQWGDHFFPTGQVMPNTSLPFDFGPTFVKRPEVMPQLDRWYCYEFMVKLNTPGAAGGQGKNDGRIAVWFDGKLVADFMHLRLRDVENLKIGMRPAKDRSQGMHCPLTNLNSVTYSEMQRGICRIQPPIVNCYRTLQMTRKAPWGLINSETLGRPGRYRMEHRYGRRLETEPSLTAD